jgi:hypothetical protein
VEHQSQLAVNGRGSLRIWPALICLAIASLPAAAQGSRGSHQTGAELQSWDELDVLTRLLSNLDITWIARVRLSEELPNPARYLFGTDWNFSVGRNLVLTPSFYYRTYRPARGMVGHRVVPMFAIEPILRRGRWTVSDRNRIGGRFDTEPRAFVVLSKSSQSRLSHWLRALLGFSICMGRDC